MDAIDIRRIAIALSRARLDSEYDGGVIDGIDKAAEAIAFELWAGNPLFDRKAFLGEVGVGTGAGPFDGSDNTTATARGHHHEND